VVVGGRGPADEQTSFPFPHLLSPALPVKKTLSGKIKVFFKNKGFFTYIFICFLSDFDEKC